VERVDWREKAGIRAFLAFVVTFAFLRGLTYGIRYHLLPVHDITSGGLHIHHFVWGILLLLLVGFLGFTLEAQRWHPWLAIAFGVGAALVLDEFALWLNLQDVYWTRQGRISVDVALGVAGMLGVYTAAIHFWNAVAREIAEEVKRLRPSAPAEAEPKAD
jgi:hypothetical protein